jgi:hypothetical protein
MSGYCQSDGYGGCTDVDNKCKHSFGWHSECLSLNGECQCVTNDGYGCVIDTLADGPCINYGCNHCTKQYSWLWPHYYPYCECRDWMYELPL